MMTAQEFWEKDVDNGHGDFASFQTYTLGR
jgi:hypothetical protein